VQRTGTEYVAALARLAHSVSDESARRQGREAATASIAGALQVLTTLSDPADRPHRF
jgi:hypothetical protein